MIKRATAVILACILLSGCSSDSAKETQVEQSSYTYYIDDLSESEVVKECNYYFDNLPSQGESFENYLTLLKAKPVKTFEDKDLECQFFDNSIDYEPTDQDVITWIRISGIQPEMDGSIGYYTDEYSVTVGMIIEDYSRASSIYDMLYDVIVDDNYYDINDRRQSTTWNTSAMYAFSDAKDSGGFGVNILTMSKEENGYHLTATYYGRFDSDDALNENDTVSNNSVNDLNIEEYDNPDGTKTYIGQVGSEMKTYWFDFSVNDAYYTSDAIGGYSPSNGKVLVVVEMTIKNTVNQSVDMFLYDFQLQWNDEDEDAYSYPIETSKELIKGQFAPEYSIREKEEVVGYYIFEAPEGSYDYSVSFLEEFDNGEEGNLYFIYFPADKK